MMKKEKLVLALLCLGSVAIAQSSVTLGTFGFSKQDVAAGGFEIVSVPFTVGSDESSVTIDEAFGDSLPSDSSLYVWDGSGYALYSYVAGLGWKDEGFVDAGTVPLNRGDALWVKNAGAATSTVIFSGDVPQSGATTNSLSNGFSLVANPYPNPITLDELSIDPVSDDVIYLWDGSTYSLYSYVAGLGWKDGGFVDAGTISIPVNIGFWYKTSVARDWIVGKAY